MPVLSLANSAKTRAGIRSRGTTGISRCVRCAITLIALLSSCLLSAREESTLPRLTRIQEFWDLASAGKQEYQLKAEVTILYYDPEWRAIWAQWDEFNCYLRAPEWLLPIVPGQRIALDGIALPGVQEIDWSRTRINVLETVKWEPPNVTTKDLANQHAQFVEIDGYVSHIIATDERHFMAHLVVNHQAMILYSYLPKGTVLPALAGAFVRARGLFSVKRDARDAPQFQFWVPNPERMEILSHLRDDARFDVPPTPIENLEHGRTVRIVGAVRSQQRGKSIVVRDASGQVQILSAQMEVVRRGEIVEAVGVVDLEGLDATVRNALFRPAPGLPITASITDGPRALPLTEEIRELNPEDAARALPVRLSGVVTWSDPETKSFFLQDASGGIRVRLPANSPHSLPEVEAGVEVRGTTRPGDFVPEVDASVANRRWNISLPSSRLITVDQALTGAEQGRWVEMRGYVQSVTREGRYHRLKLSTAQGEATARLPAIEWTHEIDGAVIQVRAVCDAIVNARHQIVGVQLWVPDYDYIEIIEPPLADPFTTPRRTIAGLRQFSAINPLNQRVQVSGTVTAHRVGEYFYLQDGDDSLLVLSRQADALAPGDKVDVVGFPGFQDWRTTIREAVYRKVAHGPEPQPLALDAVTAAQGTLDGRLVRVQGTVLTSTPDASGLRLQLQSGRTIFDASLQGRAPAESFVVGTLLDVVGVYRVTLDAYGEPRAFELGLRTADDISVRRRPSWWTIGRVMWLAVALLLCAMVTIAWSLVVARKNRLLHDAHRKLRHANDELEARVAERTRDLQQEVLQRQESQQALAAERQLLRAVIDNLPVSLFVTDTAGRFVICNHRHTVRLGAPSEAEVLGKPLTSFYPSGIVAAKEAENRAILTAGRSVVGHEEFLELKGVPGWYSTTKVPLRDRNNQIIGLIGIVEDITARKQAEAERGQLHRQLLETSRQAGMAEVATSVLHNVGNVLNSVNVSATIAIDQLRRSKIAFVSKVGALLQENASRLPEFLTADPRGKKIPDYITTLGQQLASEQTEIARELDQLRKNIEHIKGIVAMQQSYAKVSGVAETVSLSELVDDAVQMNAAALERHHVDLVREYHAPVALTVDRNKVIQILINLIRNAKYACDDSGRADKRIVLRTTKTDFGVQIAVIDNGVGIAPENLTRIFAHGFTTRKEGHGFGLHSGALAAKELGGRLFAESAGTGCGARFILDLPMTSSADVSPQVRPHTDSLPVRVKNHQAETVDA